jgi:hypothetical protein
MVANFLQGDIGIFLYEFGKPVSFLRCEDGKSMPPPQGRKPLHRAVLTDPPADTVDMISKYIGKLSPVSFPRGIRLDDNVPDFFTCYLHFNNLTNLYTLSMLKYLGIFTLGVIQGDEINSPCDVSQQSGCLQIPSRRAGKYFQESCTGYGLKPFPSRSFPVDFRQCRKSLPGIFPIGEEAGSRPPGYSKSSGGRNRVSEGNMPERFTLENSVYGRQRRRNASQHQENFVRN